MRRIRWLYLFLLCFIPSCTSSPALSKDYSLWTETPQISGLELNFPLSKTKQEGTIGVITTPTFTIQPNESTPIPFRSTNRSSLIGLSIPPLPKGFSLKGSSMIADDFVLDLIRPDEGSWMIWLTKITGSTEKVVDILEFPELNPAEVILTNYCQINGEIDSNIVARGQFDQAVYPTRWITNEKISAAWLVNLKAGVFEPLPNLKGLACSAEGGFDPNGLISQPTQ